MAKVTARYENDTRGSTCQTMENLPDPFQNLIFVLPPLGSLEPEDKHKVGGMTEWESAGNRGGWWQSK